MNTYSFTTYYEYGTDKDGTDHKGAYLTREYSELDGSQLSKYYVYDFLTGDVKAEIDGNGNRTDHENDIFHRITKTTNPDGGTWQYKYIDTWNQNRNRKVTDPNGVQYSYSYDIFGAQVECGVYDKGQWHILSKTEYDSSGNKVKDVDANGNSVRFEYNSQNMLTRKSYWDKDSIEKEHIKLSYSNGTGGDTVRILTVTDEEGYQTRLHYDAEERLIASEATPDKINYHTERYSYDYEGNKTSYTDARNNTEQYIYDDLNRLVKKIDQLGNETIYVYNNMDKLIRKEESGEKITEYVFDALGRVELEKTFKKGDSQYIYKRYTYDNTGNVINFKAGVVTGNTDNISTEVSYAYDSMNRIADEYRKLDESRKGHIHYQYDSNGNILHYTEAVNQEENSYIQYNYNYDYAGRQTREEGFVQSADSVKQGCFETRYTYDYNGNPLTKEMLDNGKYHVTDFTYDHRNRVTKKEEPYKADGSKKVTCYTYDRKGNVTGEIRINRGITCPRSYEYDGIGNLVRETDELGKTTRYVYDENGNRLKKIDPRYYTTAAEKSDPSIIDTAPGVVTEYDALNRPVRSTAKNENASFAISYREYDGRGNVIKLVDGEGYNSSNPAASTGEIYEYDVLNHVTGYISAETAKYNDENEGKKYTKKYTYDGSGNVLTEEDAYGSIVQNKYYLNGQLKEKVHSDGIKEVYDYDLTGKVELTFTDRAGNVSRKYMNIFGSPYRQEYPDGTSESFEYNNFGRLGASLSTVNLSLVYVY